MKVLKVRLILVPDSELGWPTVSLLHTQEQSTSVQVRSKWLLACGSEQCFTFRTHNVFPKASEHHCKSCRDCSEG